MAMEIAMDKANIRPASSPLPVMSTCFSVSLIWPKRWRYFLFVFLGLKNEA